MIAVLQQFEYMRRFSTTEKESSQNEHLDEHVPIDHLIQVDLNDNTLSAAKTSSQAFVVDEMRGKLLEHYQKYYERQREKPLKQEQWQELLDEHMQHLNDRMWKS